MVIYYCFIYFLFSIHLLSVIQYGFCMQLLLAISSCPRTSPEIFCFVKLTDRGSKKDNGNGSHHKHFDGKFIDTREEIQINLSFIMHFEVWQKIRNFQAPTNKSTVQEVRVRGLSPPISQSRYFTYLEENDFHAIQLKMEINNTGKL